MEVVCTGKLSTYPARSKYQLVVESMAPAGIGALLAQLEERRKKLAAEGLFDAARKQRIPYLPEVIGIVTSPTGAVIRKSGCKACHGLDLLGTPLAKMPTARSFRVDGNTVTYAQGALVRCDRCHSRPSL